MLISRRGFIGTAVAAAGFPGAAITRAKASAFDFKLSSDLPATHPIPARTKEAADAIRKETNGRFDLQVFPNSQLGSAADVLAQVRSGALEFAMLSGVSHVSTLIPKASIYGVGFAFPDYDAVWKAMDGALGAHLRQQMSSAGLIAMDKIWDSGFRQITTRPKPIRTPDDLSGLKLRVPPSALYTSLFKNLGTSPTSVSLNDVYSALQTRVVDGQENPLATIYHQKFYEVQQFCSLTNHMWDGYWLVGSRRIWDTVPSDLKELVSKRMDAACIQARTETAELNRNLKSELSAKGIEFIEPDRPAFREVLRKAGFYEEWKGRYGEELWGVLEQATGKLG